MPRRTPKEGLPLTRSSRHGAVVPSPFKQAVELGWTVLRSTSAQGGATLPQQNNSNALVFAGSGIMDSLVNGTSSTPLDTPSLNYPGTAGCGHDAACMWGGNQSQINDAITGHAVQSCPNPQVFLPKGVVIPLSAFKGGSTPVLVGGGALTWNEFDLLQMLLNGYAAAAGSPPPQQYRLCYGPCLP